MKAIKSFLRTTATAFVLLTHATGHAATVVNCDEVNLRSALDEGGTVTFGCDGIIPLTSEVIITGDLILDATGHQVWLDGRGTSRIFLVESGASLVLSNLTLAAGASTSGGAIRNFGSVEAYGCTFSGNTALGLYVEKIPPEPSIIIPGEGGALWNDGSAALRGCTFTANQASGFSSYWGIDRGAYGGAIWNRGDLLVTYCYFTNNYARGGNGLGPGPVGAPSHGGSGKGGAIYDTKSATILGSTFAGNRAKGGTGSAAVRLLAQAAGHGGLASGGAVHSEGLMGVTNCTFVRNEVIGGSGGAPNQGLPGGNSGPALGGGIAEGGGVVVIAFSTLATNSASTGGALNSPSYGSVQITHSILAGSLAGGNTFGPIQDLGYNLSSDSSVVLTNTGSLTNTDPILGPLAYNGGPTLTMALLSGSPAIDAGGTECPPEDQRGMPRPIHSSCDLGAFEAQSNEAADFRIRSITSLGSGKFRLEGNGPAGTAYRLLATVNWSDWVPTAASGVVGPDSRWQVEVSAESAHRFFRIISP